MTTVPSPIPALRVASALVGGILFSASCAVAQVAKAASMPIGIVGLGFLYLADRDRFVAVSDVVADYGHAQRAARDKAGPRIMRILGLERFAR